MFRLVQDERSDDEAMLDEFIASESINDESRGEWLGGMIVATVTLFIVGVSALVVRFVP